MQCFVGCFRAWFLPEPDSKLPDLRILSVNDVYKPERLALVRTVARAAVDPGVLVKQVLPGDLLGGSLYASEHLGESTVDVLNSLGVDYCLLGNHEFDYGEKRLRELMDKSRFPWLGSNVRDRDSQSIFHTALDSDTFWVQSSHGPVLCGLFGLCTPATPQLSDPGHNISFEDPISHARRCVKALRASGCELIVALTHLSLHQDKQLAESCDGIHVILGGHDHDPYYLIHHGVLIAKCGQNAEYVGILDLYLTRALAGVEVKHSFHFRSTAAVKEDPAVVEAVCRWKKSTTSTEEELCVVGSPLSSRTYELRSTENAFGCLVADAAFWACRPHGCHGAIINGGFIRQDRLYPAHSVLTAQQVSEELPFAECPAVVRMTGQSLRYALEEMLASAPTPVGCFPHVSTGMAVSYDPSAPPFARVQGLEVDGRTVDPDEQYLVAINRLFSEVAADGVRTFCKCERTYTHHQLFRDLVMDYLRERRHVSGELPGRLVPVTAVANVEATRQLASDRTCWQSDRREALAVERAGTMRRRRYATLPTEDMLEKITKMMNRMTTLRKIEELHSPRTPVTARLMKQSLMSADGKTADTTTTSRKSTRKTGTATTTDMCDLKKKFNWMHRQPVVHNASHPSRPSSPVESNQTVHDSSARAVGGQPPPTGLHQESIRTGWLVTSSCWAILTLVAAAIALWLKRPELAERGMCFVTKRISKMKWEPELQRKEVAVQAGEPCNDRPQDIQDAQDLVSAFIAQYGVDASAEGALRNLPADAQRQVIGEGPLRGLNASALLMSRIRRVQGSLAAVTSHPMGPGGMNPPMPAKSGVGPL
ncbi:yfkN [Symbiodinium necroappetens]|uniref:YfkN protein n=1 Tax=Symbiodinium necroappetens TaxID=1628268 RepID=A0A812JUH8_9DINO|nr:yfkN [Symbiodinium necroappetens]